MARFAILLGEVEAALREQAGRRPSTTFTAAYRVEDADALTRVLDKLRGQGLESRPIAGIEDARRLGPGVAVVGGDTLVAVLADGDGESDRLLRERLGADGGGPEPPAIEDDLVAVRAAPTLLGAWLDRTELDRALGTSAGRALRGAQARLRLEEDAARGSARVDFEGLPPDELPLAGPGPLALPPGEGVASASANQSLTTVFLARLARELYPDSRAREVAAMPTEPAEEAATRLEVDVAALLERSAGQLGEQASGIARALVERAAATASAQDGDIAAEAEVRWAR